MHRSAGEGYGGESDRKYGPAIENFGAGWLGKENGDGFGGLMSFNCSIVLVPADGLLLSVEVMAAIALRFS